MNFIKPVLSFVGEILFGVITGFALMVAVFAAWEAFGPFDPNSLEDSVYRIKALDERGAGTGFLLDTPRGAAVITNEHVCAMTKLGRLIVENRNGRHIVNILARDFGNDLCMLEGTEDGTPLTLSRTGPRVGDTLYVAGHPQAKTYRLSSGKYLGIDIGAIAFPQEDGKCPAGSKEEYVFIWTFCTYDMELGVTTADTFPGNSGSPVVTDSGEVIGVINSGIRDGMNEGNFIPLRNLKNFLRKNNALE